MTTAGSTSGGGRQHGPIGRHDVFISYSRSDRDFVISLNDALQRRKRDAWVDWEGIPPTAEWMAEIEGAIESADSFLLVMSPASMSSRVCSEEVSHALALNKRIIPVVRQESDPDLIPGPIAALNWIFFRAQDDFDTALETLIDTLDTDLDWVRAHTRLLVRAREWDGRGRDKSLLVRGSELQSAERWLTQQGADKKPAPSALHTQYILASRSAATARQRGTVSAALLAVMISSGLAFLAWDQRNEAIKEREVAQQRERVSVSRELAASSTSELSVDPEVSLVLAVRAVGVAPTQEAEYALTQALVTSHERVVLSPTSDAVSEAILSPDGRLALTVDFAGPTQLWNERTSSLVSILGATGHAVGEAAHFSPDGATVLTTDSKGNTRLWQAATGKLLRGFTRSRGFWSSFSPDGTRVVTLNSHGGSEAWKTSTGRRLPRAPTDIMWAPSEPLSPDGTESLSFSRRHFDVLDATTGRRLWGAASTLNSSASSFSPDGKLLAAATGKAVHVWATRSGKPVATLQGSSDVVEAVAFSPDGKLVAAGSESLDGAVRVWRASTGALVARMDGHTGDLSDVAFSPDSRFLVSGSTDQTARVWKVSTGESLAVLRGHTAALTSVAFSEDGDRVITAGADRTVRIWDVAQGRPFVVLRGHRGQQFSPSIAPDDGLILTRGRHNAVRVLTVDSGVAVALLRGHRGSIDDAEFSPDGTLAVTSSRDHTARVWDVRTGRTVCLLRAGSAVTHAEFSPQGTLVLATTRRGPPQIWDLSGKPMAVPAKLRPPVTAADFSPDGKLVIATDAKGRAVLWPTAQSTDAAVLGGGHKPADFAQFSPDSTLVLTFDYRGTLRSWETATGKLLAELGSRQRPIWDGQFSPDGERLVTTGIRHAASIWDPSTGRQLEGLPSRGQVLSGTFSPDGEKLATGSADHTIRIWDAETGRLLQVLRGHTSDVFSAAFDPTGRFLVSAADDGSVRVWDMTLGKTLIELPYNPRWQSATFTPAGRYVMITDYRGSARLYACDACQSDNDRLALARSRITRPLTPEQRHTFLHR